MDALDELLAAMTPVTLAAMIEDAETSIGLAGDITRRLTDALVALVGEDEATDLLTEVECER
jgi:hypothetical protein